MKKRLIDMAKVIRSKNAGPFEITLDIICRDSTEYVILKEKQLITKQRIAALYGIPEDDILQIIYFDPAHAVKITMRRRIPSGAFGETDIYGAQQHAPLLQMEFDIDV